MWSVGLSSHDMERIRACMDAGHSLIPLSEDTPPTEEDARRDKPVLVWMGESFHQRLVRGAVPPARFLKPIPRVLVLPEDCSPADIEDALDKGFTDVLRGTRNSERIHRILRRSLEKGNMHRDMERMMREILMNRELLSRKSEVFAFLLDFVLQTSSCATREQMLCAARESLGSLVPLVALHMALWNGDSDEAPDLYLDALRDSPVDGTERCPHLSGVPHAWAHFLIGAVESFFPERKAPAPRFFYRETDAPDQCPPGTDLRPDTQRILLLPLCSGGVCRGALALLLEREYPLGRDEAVALDAAATHLAALLAANARPENSARPESGVISIAG